MKTWIADTEPSERFPIYTRANADEVGPEPFTPLNSCWFDVFGFTSTGRSRFAATPLKYCETCPVFTRGS